MFTDSQAGLLQMLPSIKRGLGRMMKAALVGAVLLVGAKVRASIVPLSMEEMVAIADNIVEVEVTETESHPYNRMIVTTAKFQVVDRLKGNMKGEQSITYLGGKVGPLVMDAATVPKLHKDDRAILFLSRPIDRMPKEMKSRYNMTSPIISSYSIVGGVQGKIDLFEEPAAEGSQKKLMAARGVSSASLGRMSKTKMTDAEGLKNSLRGLIKVQESRSKDVSSMREIKGVYGKFAVPDRSADPAIRAFDPLPAMGYMSTKEINEALAESYAKAGSNANGEPTKEHAAKDVPATPAAPAEKAGTTTQDSKKEQH